MDVDSLYTNIEAPEGLKAVRQILELHPQSGRPDRYILQLLDIALTRNDFEFNGRNYLQLKGVAMGKKFAPAYADIYMAMWEAAALPKCPLKPSHYLRFLDDIWGVWPHPAEDFDQFVDTLNSHHGSIRLKHVLSATSMDFLDTTTYKGADFPQSLRLDVKVFFKSTDTHALLHGDSHHPAHTFPGLIKSQLLRFHRICSQRGDFLSATRTLFRVLRGRGYSRTLLTEAFNTFAEAKVHDDGHKIPLVLTHGRRSRILNHRFRRNLATLTGSGTLEGSSLLSAYRRSRTLGDTLTRARLPPLNPTPQPRIDHFNPIQAVKCGASGTTLRVPHLPSSTDNVVYVITCTRCGLRYVGETGGTLQLRLYQHLYNILNHRRLDTHLVPHFLRHGVDFLSLSALEHQRDWTQPQRRARERIWIGRLTTVYPTGLNARF